MYNGCFNNMLYNMYYQLHDWWIHDCLESGRVMIAQNEYSVRESCTGTVITEARHERKIIYEIY